MYWEVTPRLFAPGEQITRNSRAGGQYWEVIEAPQFECRGELLVIRGTPSAWVPSGATVHLPRGITEEQESLV